MSWNYSGDPSSSKLDECRFLIGDTNKDSPIMQDEEINYIIESSNGSELRLKYRLFEQAATRFSRDIKRTLGPQSEDPTGRLAYYKEQAKMYKKMALASGLSLPTYEYPQVFHKGMHNNPFGSKHV